MDNKLIIKENLKFFAENNISFTSVDISNFIKSQGIWISNTDVSKNLKNLIIDDDLLKNYTTSIIKLKNNNNEEFNIILYHHKNNSSSQYNKFIYSITPEQFDEKFNKGNKIISKNDDKKVQIKQDKKNDFNLNANNLNSVIKNADLKNDCSTKDISLNDKLTPIDVYISKNKRNYSYFNFPKI